MIALSIDEILGRLKDAVDPWAAANQAGVSIALDAFNILEILAESPAGMRVILHWAGDKNATDILQVPIARNEIEVVLTYNLGLTLEPDLALIKSTLTRPSLLKSLSELRKRVLSLAFPDEQTQVYCEYGGTEPFITPEGMPLAAYRMHFFLNSAVDTESQLINA